MAKIIEFPNPFEEVSEEFITLVRSGKVTHAVMCYRLETGQLGYTFLGGEHKTYLVGLIERAKHELIKRSDNEDGEWEEK
jgi:hypothetical protein